MSLFTTLAPIGRLLGDSLIKGVNGTFTLAPIGHPFYDSPIRGANGTFTLSAVSGTHAMEAKGFLMEFFTTYNLEKETYSLNPIGIIAVTALIIILIALALFLQPKNVRSKNHTSKQLVFSGTAMSLAIVASMFKLLSMPMGGSVTLFSMFFIALIGYLYGAKAGIITGIAYGFLQFILEPVFYTLPQMVIDYPIAFGALGLSGFFANKKHGLLVGYITGISGRFIFSFLSGLLFFAEYTPDHWNPVLYSIAYNGSYIYTEGIFTIILLCLPPIKQGIHYIKKLAA